MARKVTDGPIRNKERTKKNVIAAAGYILKKEGFSGLNLSKVADKAKVDRRLIYDYFGGLEGVVKEYLDANDYWKIRPDDVDQIVEASRADSGKTMAYSVLDNQFNSLMENEEMRRIISWGLSEKLAALKALDLKREHTGEQIITQVIDEYFAGQEKNFRAIYALLMGGVYYLTLHAKMQENPFCGIDINQEKGKEEVKKALKQMIEWTYS
jgi:DNA-binding transcriptional regulator YbjK